MLVLHYTGMQSEAAALARLCDPAAAVSAHYLIGEDGSIRQLVPEYRRAWHAGRAAWRGHTDINSRSVGIELAHPGHAWGYRPFATSQIAALIPLCRGIIARHGIPAWNIVGHSDIASDRKEDPGEAFPWADLAAAGIGWWPPPDVAKTAAIAAEERRGPPPLAAAQAGLAAFGYAVRASGAYDLATRNAVLAFQRRFRPARLDGLFDAECGRLLAWLLRRAACPLPPRLLG
jgi:N-acetylmuramoyl-L-alanine amidase